MAEVFASVMLSVLQIALLEGLFKQMLLLAALHESIFVALK